MLLLKLLQYCLSLYNGMVKIRMDYEKIALHFQKNVKNVCQLLTTLLTRHGLSFRSMNDIPLA